MSYLASRAVSNLLTKMKQLFVGIIGMMIIIALLSAACLPAGAQSYLYGDADGDGEITAPDATVVQRVVAGLLSDPDGGIAKRCAVTGDALSLIDATQIQRYLAYCGGSSPIGETISADIFFPTEDNQLPILKT